MQRRLTIALVSTALVSILLVGFGVLAMAQLSARGNAEEDVTRGLNVLTDFIDGPNRSQRQVEGLLFGSRGNLGLDVLERVTIDADGRVQSQPGPGRRGLADNNRSDHDVTLNAEEIEALANGETVFVSSSGQVDGLRMVTFQVSDGRARSVTVLASKRVTAVARETVAWFLLSSLIVLGGALLGGIWLAKRFAGPIKEIQSATAAIAAGDLSARVEPAGTDEVADLGHEVNRMASDLERSKALDRQFLMSVSHDLRTPLTAITGYAEGLADGAVTDPQSAGEVIGSHAARLDRLVGDLLDLARLDANRFRLNMRSFDLAVLAGRSVAELDNHASGHGVVLTRAGLGSATVHADPDRAAQAIGNLIDNAIKYTFEDGTIQVKAKHSGVQLEISVSDQGPGIPLEHQARIFERFYRVDTARSRETGGTGLGLSIVRHALLNHGGQVRVISREGEGTTFVLTLDLSSAHERLGRPDGSTAGGAHDLNASVDANGVNDG